MDVRTESGDSHATGGPRAEERERGSAAKATRILVVEDHDDVRRLVSTALALEGYDVDVAASAREGLQRLQEARYNLVLSDYAMPGGTGTWMLHEATRRGLMDRTAAVIVTAHPAVGELVGIDVIAKPFDLDAFLDQVRRILTFRCLHHKVRR